MATTEAVREWSDGARELARYLVREGLTIFAFCRKHGLDYAGVHRALSGERGRRITIDFADAIEVGTGGKVAARLWRSATLSGRKPVDTPDVTETHAG